MPKFFKFEKMNLVFPMIEMFENNLGKEKNGWNNGIAQFLQKGVAIEQATSLFEATLETEMKERQVKA